MNEPIRYSAGLVTAYGAAVRGGYRGTYEQWCQDMANLGDNVAEVRQKAAQVEQTATAFTEQTVPAAIQSVADAGADQVQAVEAAGTDVEADINAAKTTAISALQTESATQQAAIQQKGEDTIESIPSDYTELSDDVSNLKSALANYSGLFYSGKPTNNAILFTTENVSAGDVLYYSMETSVEQQMGVLLMDSNNNQIGFFGRKHPHAGWLKYEGAIIVPEGFHHAIAQVTEAGTVKINYVCKNPSPEMIKTHMSNMLNAYNFYSLPYISVGYRLRISDGKPVCKQRL